MIAARTRQRAAEPLLAAYVALQMVKYQRQIEDHAWLDPAFHDGWPLDYTPYDQVKSMNNRR